MSTLDVPNVATLLQDLSKFNTLVDRTQQGYVNFMYLGRWMIHPDGASSKPAFQDGSGAVAARHAPAVLRRQQPGRHPVGRPDGAHARTSTAPCTACRG